MPRHTRSLRITVLALSLLMAAALSTTGTPAAAAEAGARTDPAGGTGGGPISGSLHVTVLAADTGQPIPGAFVLAGQGPGRPFAGNWGYTSPAGEVSFSSPDLEGAISVTAGAAGHAWFTIVSVDANDLVLPLRAVGASPPTYQVGDQVSGIEVNDGSFHFGDGYIDFALVLPTLRMQDMASFDLAALMGPPEIVDILGQQVGIPSNVYIPDQWELFIEIVKDHYHLYLPPGAYTLGAMSMRVPRDALLNSGGDISQIIPLTQWRKIDIRDVTVSGDTNDADLAVGPTLTSTVTLNISNIPDNSVAWCLSLGDLDGLSGMGRILPLGLTSFSCPLGSGPCTTTVHLTTTAATGEFSGMGYFPGVSAQINGTADVLLVLDRGEHGQTYSEDISSFFHPLDLGCSGGLFSTSDAAAPEAGSPPVHVQIGRLVDPGDGETAWEFLMPGEVHAFTIPGLPAEAPPAPVIGGEYRWEEMSAGLGYDLPSFDFNAFAFSDVYAHLSHLAADTLGVTFLPDPAGVATGADPRGALETGAPNPFGDRTTLRFQLERPAVARVEIFSLDGRRVTGFPPRLYAAGQHEISWQGTDALGTRLPRGVYLARLSSPEGERRWRLVLGR